MAWLWVPPHLVIAWQQRLIGRFGGATGLRDLGLLEGALGRPKNLAAYNPDVTLEELAAAYAVALAKAHAFTDGNKRIAFAVMVSFLRAHGKSLDVTESEATDIMLGVAASGIDKAALSVWLAGHSQPA